MTYLQYDKEYLVFNVINVEIIHSRIDPRHQPPNHFDDSTVTHTNSTKINSQIDLFIMYNRCSNPLGGLCVLAQ